MKDYVYPLRPYCASLQDMDMDLLKVEYRSLMIYSEAKGGAERKGPVMNNNIGPLTATAS